MANQIETPEILAKLDLYTVRSAADKDIALNVRTAKDRGFTARYLAAHPTPKDW